MKAILQSMDRVFLIFFLNIIFFRFHLGISYYILFFILSVTFVLAEDKINEKTHGLYSKKIRAIILFIYCIVFINCNDYLNSQRRIAEENQKEYDAAKGIYKNLSDIDLSVDDLGDIYIKSDLPKTEEPKDLRM